LIARVSIWARVSTAALPLGGTAADGAPELEPEAAPEMPAEPLVPDPGLEPPPEDPEPGLPLWLVATAYWIVAVPICSSSLVAVTV
jgi:hypothetical protein